MINLIKSLADETRLKILAILERGEFSVQEITHILSMGQSRISRHLKILTDAGITSPRREGSWTYYSLKNMNGLKKPVIESAISWITHSTEFDEIRAGTKIALEERKKRTKVFFDRIVGDWEILRNQFIDETQYFDVLRTAVGKTRFLADLGCGIGKTILKISDLSERFIGVDNSFEMLNAAKKNLPRQLLNRVDFRLGDLEHLPLKENEVDTVLASMVLHHLAEPRMIFEEFFRVLASDGRLIILDLFRHSDEEFLNAMADLWFGFDGNDLSNWMSAAGFIDISVQKYRIESRDKQILLIIGKKTIKH